MTFFSVNMSSRFYDFREDYDFILQIHLRYVQVLIRWERNSRLYIDNQLGPDCRLRSEWFSRRALTVVLVCVCVSLKLIYWFDILIWYTELIWVEFLSRWCHWRRISELQTKPWAPYHITEDEPMLFFLSWCWMTCVDQSLTITSL